jgi:hypothetical protein
VFKHLQDRQHQPLLLQHLSQHLPQQMMTFHLTQTNQWQQPLL